MERTALVTGASSGIGRATAAAYLEEGWSVVATAREAAALSDLDERGAHTLTLDVTEPARCEAVVEETVDATGRLDVLVNNAGFAQYGPIEDVPTRLVEAQYDVNVLGPHRLIRAALPHLRATEGTIVNVSSLSGRLSAPGMGVYSSSKAALESLSDALRVEVEPFDVDVVVVEPGPVATQFEDRAQSSLADLDRSEPYADLYESLEDWGTVGQMAAVPAEEVAATILEAGVSTDPQPRYPVGTGSQYFSLVEYVPQGVRDAVFSLVRRLAG